MISLFRYYCFSAVYFLLNQVIFFMENVHLEKEKVLTNLRMMVP